MLCLSGSEMLSVIGSEFLFCRWKQIVFLWLEANYVFDWKRIDMFEWRLIMFLIGSELICSSGSELLFVIGSELICSSGSELLFVIGSELVC